MGRKNKNTKPRSTMPLTPAEQDLAATIERDAESESNENLEAASEILETVEVEGTPTKGDPNTASRIEAQKRAKARAEEATAKLFKTYPHVKEVTVMGENGPKRVVIECTDPQTKQVGGEAVSVCQKTREIAVQDLFQVTRCAACQDRIVKKARRTRQAKKDKALRKMAREMKDSR